MVLLIHVHSEAGYQCIPFEEQSTRVVDLNGQDPGGGSLDGGTSVEGGAPGQSDE